ncbi:MAG: hypothetical protein WCD34_16970, partial [Candidatus Acidiferrum sp.]
FCTPRRGGPLPLLRHQTYPRQLALHYKRDACHDDSGYALDGAATVDWRVGKPKFAETILDLSLLAGVPHPL